MREAIRASARAAVGAPPDQRVACLASNSQGVMHTKAKATAMAMALALATVMGTTPRSLTNRLAQSGAPEFENPAATPPMSPDRP